MIQKTETGKYHTMESHEVLDLFGASTNGLNKEEAGKRLLEHGRNELWHKHDNHLKYAGYCYCSKQIAVCERTYGKQ